VFVVDETADVVFGGVGSGTLVPVLFDAETDVVGESYVKSAGAAGEYVDVKMVFALRHVGRITEESVLKQQIPPLRCGMTNKRAGNSNSNDNTTADSFASLRNDKQKDRQQQVQRLLCAKD
jgi:hypothetical protein